MVVNQPWGQNIGPLNLGVNPIALPKGATKILPKFSGEGNKSTYEHFNTFKEICGILFVLTKNVEIWLFVQILTDAIADLFHHLPNSSITDWASM